MKKSGSQWKRREGYGGPESFSEDGAAQYALPLSTALENQRFELHLADGRQLQYSFQGKSTLTVKGLDGFSEGTGGKVPYRATEVVKGIFFLTHGVKGRERHSTSVMLDLPRSQAVVIDMEIPAEGADTHRVALSHVGGCIGQPRTTAAVLGPPAPTGIVGKRFVADYGDRYAWELAYLNDHRVAWHGLRGNPGVGDVEVYNASQFRDGVYTVTWAEESECLSAVFLYDFQGRTITGHMFGFAPQTGQILNVPLGGLIVPSSEFGIDIGKGLGNEEKSMSAERNKDVVLRQHYEVWNQARYDLIDEVYDANFVGHFVGGLEIVGRKGIKDFIVAHRISFPDWTEKVVDIFAEGDRVVSKYQSTATHKKPFIGIPAKGRHVDIAEVSIYRVAQGRIVEQWAFPDVVALRQQLEG